MRKLSAILTLFLCLLAPAFAQDSGVLNDDSLKKLLDGLGYSPKKLTHGFLIDVDRDTWKMHVQIVISPDATKVGLNANLGPIANDATITAIQWRDLLISNGSIDPSSFYYEDKQQKLYLHRSLDNRGITPATLSRDIQRFVGNIVSTDPLWSKLVSP